MTGGSGAGDVWVGIDLGTQSVRALAITRTGATAGSGSRKLSSHRDGVRHEQDPEHWWDAVTGACADALRGIPASAVRGVAVDATSGTILLTDTSGRPLTPGLMYDDGRAAAEAVTVNAKGAPVWAELGYQRMQPSWALPKLLWLLSHAGHQAADVRLAHQSDFITRRLTGHDVPTDLSNALKTGAHLIREQWPAGLMDALGIPLSVLPELVRSGARIGTVGAAAAEATGLPAGTPVIAGATDGCAAQLGSGALTPGSWNSVLGTTLVLKGVTRTLIQDPLGVVYSHKAPDGHWLPGGASSTGARVISRDFAARDLTELEREAAAYEPAGVLAYPLASRGERFPFLAPEAEGFLLGHPDSDGERYAATLQGVALIERLCFDFLDYLGAPADGNLVLTGGATRSEYWCQLRADVLNRPVILPRNAEPALGMALLAASPGRQTAEVAAEMVQVDRTIGPRPAALGKYDGPYLDLVTELEKRGWLPAEVAAHARKRTA